MSGFGDVPTPALLLDEQILRRNIQVLAARIGGLGCVIRPHVKTHKSIEVAALVKAAGSTRGITVSTLDEAEHFFAAGYADIMYAVGLSDGKVSQVEGLIRRGCDLKVITDNIDMTVRLSARAAQMQVVLPVLIELDVDGHRSGIDPGGAELLGLAALIDRDPWLRLAGVMTHAGDSYSARSPADLSFHAEREVVETRRAAERLRTAGLTCPIVSVGSTPTASSYRELDGITEVRAGVYVFLDLVQAGIGIARREDIAISVLATVIGHQRAKSWVVIDAGWMALSRDRGTQQQPVDYGYGQVCDETGVEIDGVVVASANQEHGVIAARDGHAPLDVTSFPVGSRVRVRPNHACATAGQFDHYNVLSTDGSIGRWNRLHGR